MNDLNTPAKVNIPSEEEVSKSKLYVCYQFIVWPILIFTGIHLITYYIYLIFKKGFFNQETISICIYIIGGVYLLLFIHKDQVKKIFNVKILDGEKK